MSATAGPACYTCVKLPRATPLCLVAAEFRNVQVRQAGVWWPSGSSRPCQWQGKQCAAQVTVLSKSSDLKWQLRQDTVVHIAVGAKCLVSCGSVPASSHVFSYTGTAQATL